VVEHSDNTDAAHTSVLAPRRVQDVLINMLRRVTSRENAVYRLLIELGVPIPEAATR
jgi:hypothetical protein